MKRQKNLLILVGVLAALCVVIAAVTSVQKHIDRISTVSEDIISTDEDSLTQISWTVNGETLSFVKADSGWQQSDDEAFPVDQDKISELLEHFAPLTASFIIEDVTDYSQYGLDDPTGTVTLTTEDGTTELTLGGYSTMDSKRYVMLQEGTVYLVEDDVEEVLSTDHDSFMQTDSVPDYSRITKIQRTGDSAFTANYLPEEKHSYTDEYSYYTETDYTVISDDKIASFVGNIASLDFGDYATYQASGDDLETYGLSDPEVSFTIAYTDSDDQEGSFTISFGKTDEDQYYCRMNDSSIICNVDEQDYTSLTGTDVNALRPAAVLTLDWSKVTAIDFTAGDVACSVTHDGDTFEKDGEEVDFEDAQDAVDALAVTEFNSETPGEKQELVFTVQLDDEDYPSLTVAAYRYDGESCLVQLNGETLGLVSRSQVIDLSEAATAIALGSADTEADSAAASE